MRIHRLLAVLALALASCAPTPPPTPKTAVVIAFDHSFDALVQALETEYEAARPEFDIVLDAASHRADIQFREGEGMGFGMERRVDIVAPVDTNLRLIDVSRGTCDVIIGRRGTALGDLGRQSLNERGLDDQINPRLREADAASLIDEAIQRRAIGLAFATHAADREDDVRIIVTGAVEKSVVIVDSDAGREFASWLRDGLTSRGPLREHGFDFGPVALPRIAPGDS